MYNYSNPFVIDNLWMAYERSIKPEDRGLVFQNVTGYSNGIVILTVNNEGNHSIIIKEVILREVYGEKITTSVDKEILPHTSNIDVTAWFPKKLLITHQYTIEILTQRGSYIGQTEPMSTRSFLIKK